MDYKQIQELIKLVNKSNIGELSIEKDDFKITIKQNKEAAQNFATLPQQIIPAQQSIPQINSQTTATTPAVKPNETTAPKTENFLTIKSPMIGTFYRQPSPDKPIFVNVGDEIEEGQIVCIIEAMKLFNEIESEVSGRIVKVLVEDASPVEFDQPLFMVEPV